MAETGGGGESTKLQLYSNWESSCACRVRIALNLKGLDYEYKAVNLLKAEHFSPEFLKLNPMGYVPALVDGDIVISDSFAILMYLEEKYPQNPLLPKDPKLKAINFQAANIVSANIQPLQNLVILKYIEDKVGPNEKVPWGLTHIKKGFAALEKLLKSYAGKYATGDQIYLVSFFTRILSLGPLNRCPSPNPGRFRYQIFERQGAGLGLSLASAPQSPSHQLFDLAHHRPPPSTY
ncbi:PREDICTED: glutathione S-transferase 2-like isoform X1 [Ipomoea nil]|uniref:glutathione S-transferase 2-like isoform X1 n=1 Tax=Ipomoea nil TaxID=35883 RepID=UPI000900D353|nr:PREDICTED: glutathione S-transferase 2-like isoform X1 [Ipomoea nil]